MARTVAIGNQDFKDIREHNDFYVDKTGFIKEWWENRDSVTLITRPRRFGKTLTMSMVENFFSIENAGGANLFEGLSIWGEEKYRQLQGTYPVIFLSFAKINGEDYELTYGSICDILYDVYNRYVDIIQSGVFSKDEIEEFEDRKRLLGKHMISSKISDALNFLCSFLYRYYGKKVIILLDEYDTPMQEAYVNGYWDKIVGFMRALFHAAFKTNQYLERAIMTGITRVSKESVFSGLNNLKVVTVLSNKYATSFGFTEKEVFDSLDEFDLSSEKQGVKEWYDGFHFGDYESIYNPWSIINFLDEKKYDNYWANTSSDELISKLILKGGASIKIIMEDLLHDKPFSASIDEDITFKQLDYKPNAIWSLLLASGYLKVIDNFIDDRGKRKYNLKFTNLEVHNTFEHVFISWFDDTCDSYSDFVDALLSNDLKHMNEYIDVLAKEVISYLDSGDHPSEKSAPERFYHGLVLGLIAELRTIYRMESNRESGLGRYDIMMTPKDMRYDGIVIEFKVIDPEQERNLKSTADNALKQIIEKGYVVTLRAAGVSHNQTRIYGFAFRGKEVLIEGGYLSDFEGRYSHEETSGNNSASAIDVF